MTILTFSENHRHILLAPIAAWGHAKPLCSLASRIVRARPVTVTILSPGSLFHRMEKELGRQFDEHETDYRGRVRLIAIAHNEANMLDFESSVTSFVHAYTSMLEGRPLICSKTSKEFAPLPRPDVVIVDMFANAVMHRLRKLSRDPVKVYCWVSCSAAAMSYFFGPAGANKDRNALTLVEAEAERTGRSVPEAAVDIMFSSRDEVTHVPGQPAMYEYEHFPQAVMLPVAAVAPLHMAAADMLANSDGVLIASPHAYESPEMISSLESWFAEDKRDFHLIGPMLNPRKAVVASSDQSTEFDQFMASVLESHGPKSMLYISFGTVFWPVDTHSIWTFIDVLLERNVPFIFSHGSPFAQVPEEVKAKVAASGIGLLAPWSPQEAILSHPATGWFVSHCGFNSTMETVAAGVPLICWPYAADQPMNVAHLTQNLEVAYELTEVRSGIHGRRPMYRTGAAPTGTPEAIKEEVIRILGLAFGDGGRKKRMNMEKLRDAVAHAWTEEGASHQALGRFLNTI